MTRDDELTRAKMRHPAYRHKMIRDVEAFAREAAHRGIDVTPLHTRPWESETRPRTGKRRDVIATVAALVLLILAMFIIISAIFASAAHADTADDWAGIYGIAVVCETLDDHQTVPGLVGIMQAVAEEGGLTGEQSIEAVGTSVLRYCPEYSPILRKFAMRYGRAVA